jgi:hypothetical protein
VAAVRGGGKQLEVDAPQDGWFPPGPAALSLVLRDGSQASVVYESVGALATKGWGGLIFTSLDGEAFPPAATWAAPGGPAAGPARPGESGEPLSSFPRRDVHVQDMYHISWVSPKRDEVRVECPASVFPPGPSKMLVRSKDKRGMLLPGGAVEYSRAAPVVADDSGAAGILFSASRLHLFPEGAAMAAPVAFHVVAVRTDGTQMQALSTLASFPPGPASVRLVRADGRASAFPYQTVVELQDRTGVLFTAPRGFLYPEDADFVEKIATVKQDALSGAQSVDEAQGAAPSRPSGGTPWLDQHPTGALVVTEASASSGHKVSVSVAVPGASLYTDRVAALLHVPVALYGMPLIALADVDVDSHSAALVRLRASVPSYVYILRDPRGTPADGGREPLWLTSSFVETADRVQTSMPGMPSLTVYRSKTPMLGPIRLGGNAAFPSRGARNNYAVVLKAARVEGTLAPEAEEERAPAEEDAPESAPAHAEPGAGQVEVPRWAPNYQAPSAEAAAAAGAAAGAKAGAAAAAVEAGKGVGNVAESRDVNQAIVDDHSLVDIVSQCGSKKAARACLEHMHTCMAPYKMGDISSCHCFTTSWASGNMPWHNSWAGAGWCTDRCRSVVWGLGFGVWGCGLLQVSGLEFRVSGLGLRVAAGQWSVSAGPHAIVAFLSRSSLPLQPTPIAPPAAPSIAPVRSALTYPLTSRSAVYEAYESKVVAATGFRMGCGLGK